MTPEPKPAIDAIEVRKRSEPGLRTLIAAILAVLVSCQLLAAAAQHDVLAHAAEGDAHSCPVCLFAQAHEAGTPALAEILPPEATRSAAPDRTAAPRFDSVAIDHPARGPPATLVS